jgi:hypothetical protein
MTKRTVLQIVQDILSDMDSDEVNSIDDTIEAQQVAQIIETCYYEMLGNRNWPHLRKVIQLESSIDLAKPNYMKLPENLKELSFFKYETQKTDETKITLSDVLYKQPHDFLHYISHRNSDNDNIIVVTDFGGSKLLVQNDKAPNYWTSFDDTYIVTDSYDAAVDDTLKTDKSQALAYIIPEFERINEFVPDLPIDAFPALIEEAKSTAFFVLKQMANTKAEQKAARQQRWLSRKSWRAEGGIKYEDYGRKGRR